MRVRLGGDRRIDRAREAMEGSGAITIGGGFRALEIGGRHAEVWGISFDSKVAKARDEERGAWWDLWGRGRRRRTLAGLVASRRLDCSNVKGLFFSFFSPFFLWRPFSPFFLIPFFLLLPFNNLSTLLFFLFRRCWQFLDYNFAWFKRLWRFEEKINIMWRFRGLL